MYHSHPEIRRARRWAEPAWRCVGAGSGRVGKPGNQLRPWDLVQPRGSRVSPANHRGGGWDFEPVTASTSVGRIASELCGSACGWRRVARVAGSRLQPYRMETCDTEEPDEGKLHVRIRGEAGGASPRLYPDNRAADRVGPEVKPFWPPPVESGHWFFLTSWFGNPDARKCLHCGLPKWSEHDPDE